MYESATAVALEELGHKVEKISWNRIFAGIIGRIESKYGIIGPCTRKFNIQLIRLIRVMKPDIVLTWRDTHILPKTLKTIKAAGVKFLATYCTDDFSGPWQGAPTPWSHKLMWRLFLNCAPYYDFLFVKRGSNIEYLRSCGVNRNYILNECFAPELHYPVKLNEAEQKKYGCDVVFIGHHEHDERVVDLRSLVNVGMTVKLYGGGHWTRKVLGDLYEYFAPIYPAIDEEYPKALCGAKICLVFLSKLNRDTYTTRCFEIPACGKVMLAERTDDLMQFFKEDEEACFFSSPEELVRKAQWLINNPDIRERIAQAGLRRVWADGHDVVSRAKYFLSVVNASRQ
jgi:spore maturation protein CgeB